MLLFDHQPINTTLIETVGQLFNAPHFSKILDFFKT
jgi:hypothetical protein